ncbi:MAG TPA: 3-hydroxyacyl-CoA dehydrogenase/enoyl-CoA hydratase family protein [Chitinophagales bacterium]|jgi:3-hydroxyacyl-CoA dehydrogenase|nr:3-hydroxyacyl-CoA dehydrogenase/enoyl-CoA hydratase family protein [Chitinophagales bacterium]MBP6154487.1 3-hydroxyacyl-CoA dehydrogenase/enoyl-CoA hydratase family protein [Chitinophagales bacterium]HQV77734.1 3-hydroxyacyl-CoA dehydrogenase/enoyl-CoA hydratase family protein [Chitinophagales bacterium]HQW78207.1 3-hydroxyacyl-CoA dehydrogenase/enoyl-CoA hydratase family protein [Chitinophagales bacterium]HRB92690.1 3-hydroxyacyl-CoA dehydrogenase/enoyl-CoA hydratase family protein [Chitin
MESKQSRAIRKVAVLGSGVMGSGIALHFANIGLEVLLLDIVPFDLKEEEKANPKMRNKIVNDAFTFALKSKPAQAYNPESAKRVTLGNFDDDMSKIKDCDWVIEVVIERLDIKKQVFEKVDALRKKGSLVTSNTSGIPIHLMAEGRSEDFQKNFCGTHFFNPPRYLRLLEVIPTPNTSTEVVDFLMNYGDVHLGKETVLCKDTPAFIANRVGVYAMAKVFQLTQELGLTIEEVDALTGPAIGRPKTGTFKLSDLVGNDTGTKVMMGIKENCPNDEQAGAFEIPKYVQFLLDNKFYGNKSKKGYYYKDEKRNSFSLRLDTLEYAPTGKPKFASLDAAKKVESLQDKVNAFIKADDKGAQMVKRSLAGLFAYVSNRVPEISDVLYAVDDALRAGFAWEIGPFQYWDIVGVQKGIELAEADGLTISAWVKEMLAAGNTSFYKIENGVKKYYDQQSKSYKTIPGAESFIILENLRANKPVWKNSGGTLHDIGDGVLNLEFTSKMNSLGGDVLAAINKSIEIAEKGYKGLVIGNDAPNFSVGANLMMISMLAMEQEFDELDIAIRQFQQTTMRCRYSSVPVVSAPHGMTLGGGCEVTLHSDAVIASAETYMGLVEVGVGLIPAGGGTKELALRTSDSFKNGDPMLQSLQDNFLNIAMAKVGTSAKEAFDLGLMRKNKDRIVVNAKRVIAEAKQEVIRLSEEGYTQNAHRNDITVLGRTGLGTLTVGVESFVAGGYISAHDAKIAKKIAYVMCGGDLSAPTQVNEQYLLDLEREAFLSLCGEKKTLERIQAMLTTGKPLRN